MSHSVQRPVGQTNCLEILAFWFLGILMCVCVCVCGGERYRGREEENVLINDALNTYYLRLYFVRKFKKVIISEPHLKMKSVFKSIKYNYDIVEMALIYKNIAIMTTCAILGNIFKITFVSNIHKDCRTYCTISDWTLGPS